MPGLVERIAEVATSAIELVAIAVIAVGVADAVVHVVRSALRGDAHGGKHVARLKLGRWLALALELELAADVVQTAVAPTWTDIGKLAAIIGLRTVLNFFLQRDIERTARIDAAESCA